MATILSLYRRHEIRNVRAILAILSLHNPSLVESPHNADSSNYEDEHIQDMLGPDEYNKTVANAGLTRKLRDRVPSDKEKIIYVLQQRKCKDYIDDVLTKEEVRLLKAMGVKTLGSFEGRGGAVESGDKGVEDRNEEMGLQTPDPDKLSFKVGATQIEAGSIDGRGNSTGDARFILIDD